MQDSDKSRSSSRQGADPAGIRERWPRLTPEDIEAIGQDRELLLDLLVSRYDSPRDELSKAVDGYLAREMTP